MSDDFQKQISIDIVGKTDKVDKQIDTLKKNIENKGIDIPINIDIKEITSALKAIQGMVQQMNNLFKKDIRFTGLQQTLDDIYNSINKIVQLDKKGKGYININPIGIEDLNSDIRAIVDNLRSLNETKIDLGSFKKLEKVFDNIETLLSSIVKGMNFDAIRPSHQVQADIDSLNEELNKLEKTESKINKLENYLNKTGINKGRNIIEWGDSQEAGSLDNYIKKLKEYISIGGDLSKITFKAQGPEDIVRNTYSLFDVFNVLKKEGKIDIIDSDRISDDIVLIGELKNKLHDLNDELIIAQNRENRDLKVSFGSEGIEEFAESIKEALRTVGEFNFKFPSDFSFDGLSTENLNEILGKLNDVVVSIRDIGNYLTTGVDTSNLHIKELDIDVNPVIDSNKFVQKIEDQLKDTIVQVKANVEFDVPNDTKPDEKNVKNGAIIDKQVISGLAEDLSNVANDFGFDLSNEIEGLADTLNTVFHQKIDYDNLFSSLRESLLNIVTQFQNSLNNVSFSGEQTNSIYNMLKQWNEASNMLLHTGNKDAERAALLNVSKGTVSNSYLYGKDDSFSGMLLNELNRLSAGISNQIGEAYDTWVHSHPFKNSLFGMNSIGADVGFTPEDIEIYKKKYLSQNVSNMMVASNGKYTNINWDGISEEIIDRVIQNFKASDIFKNGKFDGNKAIENGVYSFDKQTELINGALINAMKSAGIENAEQRLTFGNIKNLNVDMQALQESEIQAKNQADQLLSVLEKINGILSNSDETIKINISEESLNRLVDILKQIPETVDTINEKSIEIDIDNKQKESLTNDIGNSVNINVGTTGMTDEKAQAINLGDAIKSVTSEVDNKTRAFIEEKQTVVGVVQREVTELEVLDGQLYEIITTIEQIQDAVKKLDFSFLNNINDDKNLNNFLETLKYQLDGLNVDALSQMAITLSELKDSKNASEHLKNFANALSEFRQSLSGITADENRFLSSIDSILSKKDELANLAKILESSAKKIQRADQAVKNSNDSIEKDTSQKEALKVMSLKKAQDILNNSTKEYLELKEKETSSTATDEELSNLKDLVKLREDAFKILSDKTESSMHEAKVLGVGDDFANAFVQAEEKIDQLNASLKAGEINAIDYKIRIDQIVKSLKGTKTQKIVEFFDPGNLKDSTSINNLKTRMQKIAKGFSNTKVSTQFNDSTRELTATWTDHNGVLQKIVFSYNEVSGAISKMSKPVTDAEKRIKNFATRMKQGWANLGQYLSSFVGFYEIVNQLRQGVQIIRDLDTALTEMRKVSDESLSSLKKFQVESFDIASTVGTTAKQIQNSTADWMKNLSLCMVTYR